MSDETYPDYSVRRAKFYENGMQNCCLVPSMDISTVRHSTGCSLIRLQDGWPRTGLPCTTKCAAMPGRTLRHDQTGV
jgi:hypothetical protein